MNLQEVICTPGFEVPPYSVEHCNLGSCVVNAGGFNCIHGVARPGIKFVSAGEAQMLADRWNGVDLDVRSPFA